MNKIYKKFLLSLFILMQILLAISAGFFALYGLNKNIIPQGIRVDGVDIGGLSRKEAVEELKRHYSNLLQTRFITIKYNYGEEIRIKYDEIDMIPDYVATIDSVYRFLQGNLLVSLSKSCFRNDLEEFSPVFKVNEGKLFEKLGELSVFIDKEPVNAGIQIKDGNIVKTPETDGLRLDVENAVKKVMLEIKKDVHKPIEFKPSNNYEIKARIPVLTLKDIDEITGIISAYSTDIKLPGIISSLKIASEAVNEYLLEPFDTADSSGNAEFSFNKCLAGLNTVPDNGNEGLNQVVSTLYAAVLTSGIDRDYITRVPQKTHSPYIQPGLDARVSGDTIDFKFTNTLKHKLMILSEVSGNKLFVWIAGKVDDSRQIYRLKTDIVQKYSPTVINVENRDLKPGQKKLISPGKEGTKVVVYRTSSKKDGKTTEELISTDIYEAVKAIVEIGPDTEWRTHPDK